MIIKIEIECENAGEVASLICIRDMERDALRDKVTELTREPLKFSLPALAIQVGDEMFGLTPDQREKMRGLIEKGVC